MKNTSCFILTTVTLLCTGCAAHMTEVVANHLHEEIDQCQFDRGDEVWITYRDNDTVKTKNGRVLDTDENSVRLDAGREGIVDIEYRWVRTLSHPVKDRWFVGLSAGTFLTTIPIPQELPAFDSLHGVGLSSRYVTDSSRAIDAHLSTGGGGRYILSFLTMNLNIHQYIFTSRTYFFFGIGKIWIEESDFNIYGGRDRELDRSGLLRLGLGMTGPISKKFNVRIEGELIGFRAYFEARLR